mgnify:FL=1
MSELVRLVSGLGSTPGAVAATLKAAGVKGEREGLRTCPVARYLWQSLGLPSQCVEVDAADVRLYERVGKLEVLAEQADLPAAVATFVFDFDHGDYPELDAKLDDSAGRGEG